MNNYSRSDELTSIAKEYLEYKNRYFDGERENTILKNKTTIMKHYKVTENEWNSWKWQVKNSIHSNKIINDIFNLELDLNSKNYWSVTPYFLSLIQNFDFFDPIFSQVIPSLLEENDSWGKLDPMNEENTQPVKRVTRRYPDRVTINVTNLCFAYCRHCQRKRNISCKSNDISIEEFEKAYEYIYKHEEIRDVLLTGGDPLIYSNEELERFIKKIRKIPHVEIIRIGTRTLSTMPQRITDGLVEMLKKYSPIYINTQFNHPNEITIETERACSLLANNGIILGNQSVLLKGINDNTFILQLLNQLLVKNKVRPYYIFHPKTVTGTHHFYVSIKRGIEIISRLRGNTSGLCIPTYIYNSPCGKGKVVLNKKNLIIGHNNNNTEVITWEGKKVPVVDDYEL